MKVWKCSAVILSGLLGISFALDDKAPAGALGAKADPTYLLKKAGELLKPTADMSLSLTIIDREPGKATKETQIKAFFKGSDKMLLKIMSPESDKGRVILYSNRELWVYFPNVRRPFKVSLDQRVTGQFSYIDISKADYARDYILQMVREGEVGGERCIVLELVTKLDDLPIKRVTAWLDQSAMLLRKAKFYMGGGRIVKECLYEDYRFWLGALRPTRMVLKDPLSQDKVSEMILSNWKKEVLPDKFFTKSFLDKAK